MRMPPTMLLILGCGLLAAQTVPSGNNELLRRYRDGEKLTYHMKGVNEDWHYEIQADGIVKKDSTGYYEEYAWSKLISDGRAATLPAASLSFRQQLTLDPNHPPSFPDLSRVDPSLVGPLTDLMTFYVDLWLGVKAGVQTGKLAHPGDHFLFPRGTPNSWADGNYVQMGEDSIDFDFTLKDVNESEKTALFVIRHVPPQKPEVRLKADWMQKAVADTPNNWVQVRKTNEGKYLASVGKETFDVEITLSLEDGRILSATLDNPLQTVDRVCDDAALTQCGEPKPHPIHRRIELTLQR
jgi:hypothetical protein